MQIDYYKQDLKKGGYKLALTWSGGSGYASPVENYVSNMPCIEQKVWSFDRPYVMVENGELVVCGKNPSPVSLSKGEREEWVEKAMWEMGMKRSSYIPPTRMPTNLFTKYPNVGTVGHVDNRWRMDKETVDLIQSYIRNCKTHKPQLSEASLLMALRGWQ